MSWRAKQESRNVPQWTYLRERSFLHQCAQLLKTSSQRLLNQVKSKSQMSDSEVRQSLVWKKNNGHSRQMLNQNISRPTLKQFLPKRIYSEGQMSYVDKYVFPHSHSISKLYNYGSLELKSVESVLSSRLEKIPQCRAQPKQNPLRGNSWCLTERMRLFEPSERLLNLATPKRIKSKDESQRVRRPPLSKATLQRIEELAQPKIYKDAMTSQTPKKPCRPFRLSARLRQLALPKQ